MGRRLYFFAMLVLCLCSSMAAAGEIWVVARRDAPVANLSRSDAADLFLGRAAAELHLTPYDRDDMELRRVFYRAVADMSLQSVRAHWAKQVFTGRGHPPAAIGAADIPRVLGAQPATVTYMPAGKLPADAKVLLSIQTGDKP